MLPFHSLTGKGKHRHRKLPSAFIPSQPSELAAPYASRASSSRRKTVTVRITFDDWDQGGIFDWYRHQRPTPFHKLELRKERDQFKHEFVLLYLDDKSSYRVERRPLGGPNTDAIGEKGCEAEDSITGPLDDKHLQTIYSDTDAEVILEFGASNPDLHTVIAVCVAIQMDPQSKPYTLQQYNCYFVARTITTIIARYYLLQQPSLSPGLRWDRVTEPAISDHIFGTDWDKLDKAMKTALIATLDHVLWPVVQTDAETRVEGSKEWKKLEDIMRTVIREVIGMNLKNLVGLQVKDAASIWILQATQATLWYDKLEVNLSAQEQKELYEEAVEKALKDAVRSEVGSSLPDQMATQLGDVLPQRLIHRLPPSLFADMPVELLARAPAKVLERLPDDLLAKVNPDLMKRAPDQFLENFLPHVFSRCPTALVLTLPDDLTRIPDQLRKVSLQRMQKVLDQDDHPDRPLALKLLRRLPNDLMQNLNEKYQDIRDEGVSDIPPATDANDTAVQEAPALTDGRVQPVEPAGLLKSLKQVSILGLLVRVAPRPVLERFPPGLSSLIPVSWLRTLPSEALARLPPRYIGRLSGSCLARLPTELLARLPESLLQELPRTTLERLPNSLLERLPMEVVRNIPPELLENLPEDLSDLLRQAIITDAFKGPTIRAELAKNVGDVMKKTLLQSRGDLPETLLRVLVKKSKGVELLKTHEQLHIRILGMVKKHSKMVAQVARFGMGEQAVYTGLCNKSEEIWRVARLHGSPPSSR